MAAVSSLVSYSSGSESDSEAEDRAVAVAEDRAVAAECNAHLKPLPAGDGAMRALDSAPEVAVKEEVETGIHLDPSLKEIQFNPTYETMFAPELGPNNPFKTQQMAAPRNMLSGYAEPTHINDFMFEQQRRTFATYGYALDPSIDIQETATKYIGSVDDAEKNQGHSKAVRDICFNNAGTQFLSAAYDRYLKLWDTETGQCISRFTNRKVPYCVKFNPDEDKQSLLVAGMSDKKIVQWDIRSGEIVQEYDRHLGAVNTITFVDENRRFVSTSDDKSLRVWEWDIPVDFKYIAEPSMHSMPAVTLSPNGE
ncbi:hypothetical protein FKM82_010940 [Ascaphus truei]